MIGMKHTLIYVVSILALNMLISCGKPKQIASVRLNGKEVLYQVKEEHIVIAATQVVIGENCISLEFTADDQSLNRRDEFLLPSRRLCWIPAGMKFFVVPYLSTCTKTC